MQRVTGIGHIGGADIPQAGVVLDAVKQVEVFRFDGAQTNVHEAGNMEGLRMTGIDKIAKTVAQHLDKGDKGSEIDGELDGQRDEDA